jgi:hypothetical protein
LRRCASSLARVQLERSVDFNSIAGAQNMSTVDASTEDPERERLADQLGTLPKQPRCLQGLLDADWFDELQAHDSLPPRQGVHDFDEG